MVNGTLWGSCPGNPVLSTRTVRFSVSISIILYCLPSCIRIEPSDFWLMINSLDGTSSILNFSVISKSPTKTSFIRLLISKINKRPILLNDILEITSKEPEMIKINNDTIPLEGYLKSLEKDKEFIKSNFKED